MDAVQLISVADFLLVWRMRENQGECGYFFLRKVFIPTHEKKDVFLQLRQRGAQHAAEKEIPVHLNWFTGTEWCLHPSNHREGMCLQNICTCVKGSLRFFKGATKMSNPSFPFHHSCWSINSSYGLIRIFVVRAVLKHAASRLKQIILVVLSYCSSLWLNMNSMKGWVPWHQYLAAHCWLTVSLFFLEKKQSFPKPSIS